jgi:hypothetical protein
LLVLNKFLVYNTDQTKEINLQTNNQMICARLMAFAHRRGPGKTFCPSEIARQLEPKNWRGLMEVIRFVGQELVEGDFLLCTQKGNPVNPLKATGPIRFGLSPTFLREK